MRKIPVFVGIKFYDKLHSASVILHQFLEGRTDRHTVRSLIINELDHSDGRLARSIRWGIFKRHLIALFLRTALRDEEKQQTEQQDSRCPPLSVSPLHPLPPLLLPNYVLFSPALRVSTSCTHFGCFFFAHQ